MRHRFAGDRHPVRPQLHRDIRVVVNHGRLRPPDGAAHPELFSELALQCFFVGFPRFDLSAGELPPAAARSARLAMRNQKPPVALDDRGGDGDASSLHGLKATGWSRSPQQSEARTRADARETRVQPVSGTHRIDASPGRRYAFTIAVNKAPRSVYM